MPAYIHARTHTCTHTRARARARSRGTRPGTANKGEELAHAVGRRYFEERARLEDRATLYAAVREVSFCAANRLPILQRHPHFVGIARSFTWWAVKMVFRRTDFLCARRVVFRLRAGCAQWRHVCVDKGRSGCVQGVHNGGMCA